MATQQRRDSHELRAESAFGNSGCPSPVREVPKPPRGVKNTWRNPLVTDFWRNLISTVVVGYALWIGATL